MRLHQRVATLPDLTPLRADRVSMETWLATVPPVDAAHVPTLLRPMATSLANELRECHDLLAQLDALEQQPVQPQLSAQYADKLARLRSSQETCLLYTSPSPRDRTRSRMPSSA